MGIEGNSAGRSSRKGHHMGHPQQYIHNVASSIMGQLNVIYAGSVQMDTYASDETEFPQELWGQYGFKVVGILSKMGPSALGRIAACGVGYGSTTGNLCHWEVNQGRNLNAAYDGKDLLTYLAAYVVVAAMVDIIRADVRKTRELNGRKEDELDHAMKEYTHREPNSPRSGMPIPHSSRYTTR